MDERSRGHIQSEVRIVHPTRCAHGRDSRARELLSSFGSSVDINFSDTNDGSYSCDALRNNLGQLPDELTDYVRTRLRSHFMNPVEKWRSREQFPWKLFLQIFKVLVVTAQVIVFGSASSTFQDQHRNTRITLEHLLLKGWDTARDVLIYPPPQGPYAVYTITELYEHIEYVVKRYSSITSEPIGTFWYSSESEEIVPIELCVTKYKNGTVWPSNSTLFLDSETVTRCVDLNTTWPANSASWRRFSMKKFLSGAGIEIVFEQLIRAELRFTLTTLYKRKFVDVEALECYRYGVFVIYHNSRHSGQIGVTLKTTPSLQHCSRNSTRNAPIAHAYYMTQVLNAITIAMCSLSTVLCSRSLYRAQKLRVKTTKFFKAKYKKKLSLPDKLLFLDLWFVMIIVDDCLLVIGSSLKIQIDERMIPGLRYNLCSLFLGSGTLFAWCGLLRYVGYFKTYNILILTLKKAIPNVLRFLLCGALLFSGYVICGWVVIGPHHIKFKTTARAAECLFSITNGDDIFSTFAMMFKKNTIVWYFVMAYLYSFIILFVYLVVSLFVAIIVDSYEIIKDNESVVHVTNPIQQFIAEAEDNSDNELRSSPTGEPDLKRTKSSE